jgi:hypothetical protein
MGHARAALRKMEKIVKKRATFRFLARSNLFEAL